MALVRVANLLEVHRWDDNPDGNVGAGYPTCSSITLNPPTVSYNSNTWRYLPFVYTGAVRNRAAATFKASSFAE